MRATALLAALAAVLAVGPATAEGAAWHTVVSGGRVRSYRVFVPRDVDRTKPLPVVFVFHGYGQSVRGLVRSTGFDAEAARSGFLAVYPASVGPGWAAGDCCGYGVHASVDDVAFVDDVLADLGRRFRLDPRRTFSTGISNGGIFSYWLACQRARRFAAVGPVAATMDPPCRPAQPVSVMHVHGLADTVLPFRGGEGARPGIDWTPVSRAIAFWRKEDRCGRSRTRDDGLVRVRTSRCTSGTAVRLVTVAGLGHRWPTEPYDATRALWRFFSAHPRR